MSFCGNERQTDNLFKENVSLCLCSVQRELEALQDLCLRAGVPPDDIDAICSNARSNISHISFSHDGYSRLTDYNVQDYGRLEFSGFLAIFRTHTKLADGKPEVPELRTSRKLSRDKQFRWKVCIGSKQKLRPVFLASFCA